ncbi:hypothetical protein QF028_004408 [Neobacillus sp. B4I6]|uniref:hypothetical protein n=1 Tax=Neobacillus sp. B4I6 TaxID=3373925 RepID=UPI003D22343F
MVKPKLREKGETFRPIVQVLKTKNGEPTSISFNGNQYALVHPRYINGGKNKVKNSHL